MRILVVEDEKRLAANIVRGLQESGFTVDHALDGEEGLHSAEQSIFDLVVLDLMLPFRDGRSVIQALRRRHVATPVLILTAQEGKESVVELLNYGADDYMGKPFDMSELIARAKALIRRSKGNASPLLAVSDIQIDTVRQLVFRKGQSIELSPTEFRILEYLAQRPSAVVSKRELLEHLYDYEWEHHSNVIEAHVSNLRKKLDCPGGDPVIATLRHRGYRLYSGC